MWIRRGAPRLALLAGGSVRDGGGRLDNGRPCRTLPRTHQKLLGAPLPSLLANLAASEGSSRIHGSERRLNQPVIGGSTARRSCPRSLPPVRKPDFVVLRRQRRSRPSLIEHPAGKGKHLASPLPRPAASVRLCFPRLLCGRPPSGHHELNMGGGQQR